MTSAAHNGVWLLSEMAAPRHLATNPQPSAPSTTTKVGRDEQSTVAIADSESVKTTEKRGEVYSGGKKG